MRSGNCFWGVQYEGRKSEAEQSTNQEPDLKHVGHMMRLAF